jgi:menaquinone-dependent protoporphyrinogen IX oxidase
MKIEYFHASKFGNGAKVAEEFRALLAVKGVTVNVHHVRDVKPKELLSADLYLFSSPGRMGKPIGRARRFLKKVALPAGTKYALLTTEGASRPDKRTGRMPTEEEMAKVDAERRGDDPLFVADSKLAHVLPPFGR